MARILIVGSKKSHNPAEFEKACRAIGESLARRGHTIVAAGCGNDDAETWVLEGANTANLKSKISIIPFAPAIPNTTDLLLQFSGFSARWPNLILQDPFQTRGSWAVGQAVALIRSDAALLIGGGALTENVASLALELDKPYYAVGALGGAGKIIADGDDAKFRSLGMPGSLRNPLPASPDFGDSVVKAVEFLIRHRRESVALRRNILILGCTLTALAAFLFFLFHDDLQGNKLRMILTTCAGAFLGVLLQFLVSHVVNKQTPRMADFLGQLSLASFLGILYGFFALEAGDFYKVDVAKMGPEDLKSLAENMALLGIGVGALLGPAAKRIVGELASFSKIESE